MRTARARSRRGLERPFDVATALALLVFLAARPAHAEESTVALVHASDEDDVLAEVTTRLRAELDAAGFAVAELLAEPGSDAQEQVAASGLAPAAILAVTREDGAGVDLWLPDPKTHEPVLRHVDMPAVARQRAPSALAVHAVELVRASLLGEAPPAAPAATPKPLPDAPRDGEDERRSHRSLRLGAELGAGMLYGANHVSPAFAPLLRFGVGTTSWGGELNVVAPAFGGDVSGAGGRATIREELASLDATVTLPEKGAFALVGSAGGGAYHWHVSGEGTAPNVGRDADRWGAFAEAGAGVLLRLGTRVALLLDARALLFAPPLSVRIAGVEAGRSGQPTLCTSLGVWVTP